jgi:hypothetical protein
VGYIARPCLKDPKTKKAQNYWLNNLEIINTFDLSGEEVLYFISNSANQPGPVNVWCMKS